MHAFTALQTQPDFLADAQSSLHAGCDCSSQLSARVYNNKKRVSNLL